MSNSSSPSGADAPTKAGTALVMGGTGFVGSRLCRSLLDAGYRVRATVRDSAGARVLPSDVEVCVASLSDPPALARAAQGCTVAFLCAGVNDDAASDRVLRWVNVAGAENALNGVRHGGVRRLVYISCADVTLSDQDRIHWDEARTLTGLPLGPLARSLLMAEELLLACSDARTEVVALRPARLWGEGDVQGIARLFQEGGTAGLRLYSGGRNLVATTHIATLCDAALAAATAGSCVGAALYVTDGEFLEAREFYGHLSVALGLPPPRLGQPYLVGMALGLWREWRSSPGHRRPEVVRRGRSTLFDVSRASGLLGCAPSVDLEQAFASLARWVEAQGGARSLARRLRSAPAPETVDAQVEAAGGD